MKKLTAGIFTVLMGLVSVNAADAAVASKGYVTQEINKVNENVTAVNTKVGDLKYSSVNYITQDEGLTVSAGKLDAAIKELADELSDATGGSTERLTDIEETLNGTGEGSVASKIAAAVKTEEDARKAADNTLTEKDTALQGEIDAAEGRLDTIEADYATKDYANAKVDNAVIGADASTKTTVAPSVAQVAAYVDSNFGDVDGQISELTTGLGTANEGIADNAAAIEGLKTADTNINTKLDVLNGADTVDGSVAKALKDAKAYADGLAGNYDAAGSAESAESNAKAYALQKANTAQTNAVNYTDSVVSGLNLSDIARVPADCSEPTKYCALTTNGTQFVWEVIERGVEEDGTPEKVPADDAVTLNAKTTPAKPATIE